MNGQVKILKDKDGNPIFPVTHQTSIYYDDGETLETKEQRRQTAEQGRVTAETQRVTEFNNMKTTFDSATGLHNTLQNDISTGNTVKTQLDSSIASGNTTKTNLDASISNANAKKGELDTSIASSVTAKNSIDTSITNANTGKTNLDATITASNTANSTLTSTIASANTSKTNLDNSISSGNTTKSNLDTAIATGNNTKSGLDSSIATANNTKTALDTSIANGNLNTLATKAEVNSKLASMNTQTANLQSGVNVVTAPQASPAKVKVEGMHVVNLVHNGDFSKGTEGWNVSKATLSVSDKVLTSTANGTSMGTQTYTYTAAPYANGDIVYARGNVKALHEPISSLSINVEGNTGGIVGTVGLSPIILNQWEALSTRVALSGVSGQLGVNFRTTYIDAATANGKAIQIKEVMLINLTQLFGAGKEPTIEWCDANIPFVIGVQPLRNPYAIKKGKNLLPPFSQWTLHANAKVVIPYELELNATASLQGSYVTVPTKKGQQYYFGLDSTPSRRIVVYDGVGQTATVISNTTSSSVTFTALSENTTIKVDNDTVIGTFKFTNPMLNLGSTALPFEPMNEDYLFMETDLYSEETIEEVNGQYVRTKKWDRVILSGEVGWVYQNAGTGVKSVKTASNVTPRAVTSVLDSTVRANIVGVKFNGAIMRNDSTTMLWLNPVTASADSINIDENVVVLSIANTDSGWGDSYTPTADEIKAYFMGWKMYEYVGGNTNEPYNGTGTKGWFYHTANGIPDGGTNILPLSPAPSITGGWRNYYELHYQLATPVTEVVKTEGAISLHEGGNQIEVGSAVIVREKVVPTLVGSDYSINASTSAAPLNNRVSKILNVYENGKLKQGNILTHTDAKKPTVGNEYFTMPQVNYDTTATYTVTYLALDKYKLSSNPKSVSLTYEGNIKESVDLLTERQADLGTKLSVVENTYAKKQQGQWITPTLLNGWVNNGSPYETTGYMKDEFGFVHLKGLITGGTVGGAGVAFKLPLGFRPKCQLLISVVSSNGNITLGVIMVTTMGDVIVYGGGNVYISLENISFPA